MTIMMVMTMIGAVIVVVDAVVVDAVVVDDVVADAVVACVPGRLGRASRAGWLGTPPLPAHSHIKTQPRPVSELPAV